MGFRILMKRAADDHLDKLVTQTVYGNPSSSERFSHAADMAVGSSIYGNAYGGRVSGAPYVDVPDVDKTKIQPIRKGTYILTFGDEMQDYLNGPDGPEKNIARMIMAPRHLITDNSYRRWMHANGKRADWLNATEDWHWLPGIENTVPFSPKLGVLAGGDEAMQKKFVGEWLRRVQFADLNKRLKQYKEKYTNRYGVTDWHSVHARLEKDFQESAGKYNADAFMNNMKAAKDMGSELGSSHRILLNGAEENGWKERKFLQRYGERGDINMTGNKRNVEDIFREEARTAKNPVDRLMAQTRLSAYLNAVGKQADEAESRIDKTMFVVRNISDGWTPDLAQLPFKLTNTLGGWLGLDESNPLRAQRLSDFMLRLSGNAEGGYDQYNNMYRNLVRRVGKEEADRQMRNTRITATTGHLIGRLANMYAMALAGDAAAGAVGNAATAGLGKVLPGTVANYGGGIAGMAAAGPLYGRQYSNMFSAFGDIADLAVDLTGGDSGNPYSPETGARLSGGMDNDISFKEVATDSAGGAVMGLSNALVSRIPGYYAKGIKGQLFRRLLNYEPYSAGKAWVSGKRYIPGQATVALPGMAAELIGTGGINMYEKLSGDMQLRPYTMGNEAYGYSDPAPWVQTCENIMAANPNMSEDEVVVKGTEAFLRGHTRNYLNKKQVTSQELLDMAGNFVASRAGFSPYMMRMPEFDGKSRRALLDTAAVAAYRNTHVQGAESSPIVEGAVNWYIGEWGTSKIDMATRLAKDDPVFRSTVVEYIRAEMGDLVSGKGGGKGKDDIDSLNRISSALSDTELEKIMEPLLERYGMTDAKLRNLMRSESSGSQLGKLNPRLVRALTKNLVISAAEFGQLGDAAKRMEGLTPATEEGVDSAVKAAISAGVADAMPEAAPDMAAEVLTNRNTMDTLSRLYKSLKGSTTPGSSSPLLEQFGKSLSKAARDPEVLTMLLEKMSDSKGGDLSPELGRELLLNLNPDDIAEGLTKDNIKLLLRLPEFGSMASGLDPAKAEELKAKQSALENAITAKAKKLFSENRIEMLPVMTGLFFKARKMDSVGMFLSDPIKFYGTAALLATGGAALASSVFGDDDEEDDESDSEEEGSAEEERTDEIDAQHTKKKRKRKGLKSVWSSLYEG